MEFKDLITTRKSIRKFSDQPISADQLDSILQTIALAPTAGNLQSFKVLVIQDREIINQLTQTSLHNQDFSSAQLILVFITNPKEVEKKYGERGVIFYSLQDATIACAHAQLAVHDQGLSCVWVGAFEDEEVIKLLNIENNSKPVAILPIGYADEIGRKHEHKNIQDLIEKI